MNTQKNSQIDMVLIGTSLGEESLAEAVRTQTEPAWHREAAAEGT